MQKNTFQVAIVTDGVQTFSIFMYAKLEFISAYSPTKLGRKDRYAEAGFTDGTSQQTEILPGSGGEGMFSLVKYVEKKFLLKHKCIILINY